MLSRFLDSRQRRLSLGEFLKQAGGKLGGQTVREAVMRIPGLVFAVGLNGQFRLGQRLGEVEDSGREHRGFKQLLPLLDGGDHETLAGIAVFYLVEQALHGSSVR